MNSINEKLNKYQKKQKAIKALIYSLIIIVVSVLMYYQFVAPRSKAIEVLGVVEHLVGLPGNEGEDLYILVKLEDGMQVRAPIRNVSRYKKGKKVLLLKRKSRILGIPEYRLYKYLE